MKELIYISVICLGLLLSFVSNLFYSKRNATSDKKKKEKLEGYGHLFNGAMYLVFSGLIGWLVIQLTGWSIGDIIGGAMILWVAMATGFHVINDHDKGVLYFGNGKGAGIEQFISFLNGNTWDKDPAGYVMVSVMVRIFITALGILLILGL